MQLQYLHIENITSDKTRYIPTRFSFRQETESQLDDYTIACCMSCIVLALFIIPILISLTAQY